MSVYTPPALNAVDFALTVHTPADITPYEVALSTYTPPALNAVDFALTVFTQPTFQDVGWELLPSVDPIATITTAQGAQTSNLAATITQFAAIASGQGGQSSNIAGTAAMSGAVETGQGSQRTDITASISYAASITTAQGSQTSAIVGTSITPPTPTPAVSFGGGGFDERRAKRQRTEVDEIRRAIKLAMGLVDEPLAAVPAKAIIEIVTKSATVHTISDVDMAWVMASSRKIKAIRRRLHQIEARMADDDEDDDVAFFMLN